MCVCVCVCVRACVCACVELMHTCSFGHACFHPLPPHMQQEMVTSGIIPQFAEEIVEVAAGGEMVRKEGGRERSGEGEERK